MNNCVMFNQYQFIRLEVGLTTNMDKQKG